ncbi:MAG: hypothetical protein IJL09_06230 [Lachnospiraceae bacterium]|jgi:hypothetical protein|nr:hypothetical protein [Lachnospiraceae bacterium]MBR3468547.1 hypothetical protein [Lachnospiraceae bacterium]
MDQFNQGAFPSNEIEALTLLYLQNQSLSGLAPEEIYDKYLDAIKRMTAQKERDLSEQEENY